jgi:hypothetical protein
VKRASIVACLLVVAGAAPRARAQSQVLVPSAADADALEAWGHRNKRVGITLMVAGSALAVAGTGLAIAGGWDHDDHCRTGFYVASNYYDRSVYYACGDPALTVAGATTSLLGAGIVVPGIIFYVRGANEVDEARRWRAIGTWRRRAAGLEPSH